MNPAHPPNLATASTSVQPSAYPLDEFYLQAGLPLPKIEPVPGESIPEPYRMLLVHERDMTPTLEQYHGAEIHLQVLRSYIRGDYYFREVVLRLEKSEAPVEFGANRISLFLFPPAARRLILEEHWPLGHILKECNITHFNHPKAFLRVAPDELIGRALGLAGGAILFGRRNLMVDPQGRPLSQIVEILPLIAPAP